MDDANSDGKFYGRKDGAWTEFNSSISIPDVENDYKYYVRRNKNWEAIDVENFVVEDTTQLQPDICYARLRGRWAEVPTEAPIDNNKYVRIDRDWIKLGKALKNKIIYYLDIIGGNDNNSGIEDYQALKTIGKLKEKLDLDIVKYADDDIPLDISIIIKTAIDNTNVIDSNFIFEDKKVENFNIISLVPNNVFNYNVDLLYVNNEYFISGNNIKNICLKNIKLNCFNGTPIKGFANLKNTNIILDNASFEHKDHNKISSIFTLENCNIVSNGVEIKDTEKAFISNYSNINYEIGRAHV